MSLTHYLPEEIESEIYRYTHGLSKVLNEMIEISNLLQASDSIQIFLKPSDESPYPYFRQTRVWVAFRPCRVRVSFVDFSSRLSSIRCLQYLQILLHDTIVDNERHNEIFLEYADY